MNHSKFLFTMDEYTNCKQAQGAILHSQNHINCFLFFQGDKDVYKLQRTGKGGADP